MFRLLLLTLITLVISGRFAAAQDLSMNTFGKGIRVVAQDSSFSLKYSMRFQTLYEGTYSGDNESWSDKILIRRSRLKFDGFAFSPKLEYKIELGLSNRDHSSPIPETSNTARLILDAVGKWKFAPGWALWFGQTKLPGNRERVISSSSLQFVDRSLVNSRFTLDRDVGLQLRYKHKIGNIVLKEALAISMGEGRNITSNNTGGYDYTFHLEILPFGDFTGKGDFFASDLLREPSPKLSIGLTYDFLDDAARQRGQQGSFMRDLNDNQLYTDLSTVFVDLMFKYKGLQVMAEYADKNNLDGTVVSTGPGETKKFFSGMGYVGQVGYLFQNNIEISGRYTHVEPDDLLISGLIEETEYTLGFSKYIVGHSLKVQSDLGILQSPGVKDNIRFRLQTEISF